MKQRVHKTFIYVLYDPREPKMVRYVGKANDVEKRLEKHIWDAENCRNLYHRLNWIRSLLKSGIIPTFKVLEEVDIRHWQVRERYWIKEYRRKNHPLTNGTDGGEGLVNLSLEARYRLSQATRKRFLNPKERQKVSDALRGRKFSEERKHNISGALMGKIRGPRSLEVKRKISEGHRKRNEKRTR